MPRWSDGTRPIHVAETQKLALALALASNLTYSEIEEALGVGTGSNDGKKPGGKSVGARDGSGRKSGQQFRRWLNGTHPMSSDVRQRVIANAIKLGWIERHVADVEMGTNVLHDLVKTAPPKEILQGQKLSERISAMVAERQKWHVTRSALLKALYDFTAFTPNYGSPGGLIDIYLDSPLIHGGMAWDYADADRATLEKEIQSVIEKVARLTSYDWHGASEAIGWQLPKFSDKPNRSSGGAKLVQKQRKTKSTHVKSSTSNVAV